MKRPFRLADDDPFIDFRAITGAVTLKLVVACVLAVIKDLFPRHNRRGHIEASWAVS